jgi:hypothetical protein
MAVGVSEEPSPPIPSLPSTNMNLRCAGAAAAVLVLGVRDAATRVKGGGGAARPVGVGGATCAVADGCRCQSDKHSIAIDRQSKLQLTTACVRLLLRSCTMLLHTMSLCSHLYSAEWWLLPNILMNRQVRPVAWSHFQVQTSHLCTGHTQDQV